MIIRRAKTQESGLEIIKDAEPEISSITQWINNAYLTDLRAERNIDIGAAEEPGKETRSRHLQDSGNGAQVGTCMFSRETT